MEGIKKRLFKNLSANMYAQVVTIVFQLCLIPLFLTFLSIERYGEWLLLSTFPTYIALSNMGMMVVAQNNMTMAMSNGNVSLAKEYLDTIWTSQLLMNVLLLVLIALLLTILDIKDILSLKVTNNKEARETLFILSAYALLNLQLGVFTGIYRAIGRNARGVYISNTIRLVGVASIVVVLTCGAESFSYISYAMLFTYLIGFVYIYIDSIKVAPDLRPGVGKFNLELFFGSIKNGISFLNYPIGRAITNQGMVLLTNLLLGSSFVVVLTTIRTVVNTAFQLTNIINLSTWPEFSRFYGVKNDIQMKSLFLKSSVISFWCCLLGVWFLYLTGEYLISIWTRGQVIVDRQVFNIFIFSIVLNTLWYGMITIFNATNRHKKVSFIFLAISILVPVMSYILVGFFNFDFIAIAYSYFFMELVMLVLIVPMALNLINMKFSEWLISLLLPLRVVNTIFRK